MPATSNPAAISHRPMPWRAALLPRVVAVVIALVVVVAQVGTLLTEDHHAAAAAFREAGWTAADLAAPAHLARRCTLAQRHQRLMIAGTSSKQQVTDDRNHGDDCRG